ncbi:serine protease [Paraflavisolibacter sp. H34]|uniref:S1C family serine protease n=1 Tax=Huijunlia imazamoxiresistens TaxID=3127457 RepID=UPI003017621D
MDNQKMLEMVERYLSGELSPQERAEFEAMRQANPEIDQLVVENSFFLEQLARFEGTKNFKAALDDVHMDLVETGVLKPTEPRGKAKVLFLFHKYKRTTAIAASIAGITAMAISMLVTAVSPNKPAREIRELSRQINVLQHHNRVQDKEIRNVKNQMNVPPAVYKTGGTGFIVDTKGFLVTNAHVIENARDIVVQNSNGQDLHASVVLVDVPRDLAILKIDDTAFKAPSSLPYRIRRNGTEIAEPVFTLGYPRNDIVYGEGYLSARTGFNGDTMTCQIAIAANPGNSGGPILNRNGEVIGVLSGKQTSADGVVFAIRSRFIYDALGKLARDTSRHSPKVSHGTSLRGLDRTQQVKKIADFVYMVKVN